ncbi:hypothetical protein VPNG_00545 [Cytospora leucostoma]|uniref:TM7S3/TM198-like domain-containing protein n=1 Tax=Cytospora leucostoma TaxID=1230097 RepID=A0A423XM92_9PEZI|nr:hypothetical protein VPNG_00545 [Cytospora leucostoma]
MRVAPSPRIWEALFGFFVCSNIALAGVARPLPRQDDASTTTPTVSSSATENAASSVTSVSVDSTALSVTSSSSIVSSVSTTAASVSTTPTMTGGTGSTNTTLFNVTTIAEGDLPLEPQITPGFSVAGVILILTGVAYALVGIKTRWLHCFFSVAYLAAIGVTLLIIYVMNTPVSNAIQGAYVVAAVGTGALLGGGGLVFKDITESLGCLLGGFCLAMWLITLKAGGLFGSGGSGVIIFISVLTAAGFIGYFSHWTRSYYMIACISLSGATAIVIGIDCFSRAGLKEYWAWIWNLNKDLFPLGANTYPLTRGIKVEQALTILLALKLWRIIKEHRAKKEEERAKAEAAKDDYEGKVGKDVERAHAQERLQWEAIYGNPKNQVNVHMSPDSGVGDSDSESKRRDSGSVMTTTTRHSTTNGRDGIEMSEMPIAEETEGDQWAVVGLDEDDHGLSPRPPTTQEKDSNKDGDGMYTVRVAVDQVDSTPSAGMTEGERKAWFNEENGEGQPLSTEDLGSKSTTPAPKFVALPFKAPISETDAIDNDERSSVAAVADEDGELLETRSIGSKRSSFAKRLSAGSVDLFRRLSRRQPGKQVDSPSHGDGGSMEETTYSFKDDNESVAATFDDESSDEVDDSATSQLAERPPSEQVKATLTDSGRQDEEVPDPAEPIREEPSSEPTLSTDAVSVKQNEAQMDQSLVEGDSVLQSEFLTANETEPGPATLTKDRLPRALSRVALSYRTNEWAKHLSNAEIPSPEGRRFESTQGIQPTDSEAIQECAAPVNVEELRKTAANAAPPPAMPRSASAMSTRASALVVPGGKVSAKSSVYPSTKIGTVNPPQSYLSSRVASDPRRASGRLVEAIAEEDDNWSIMSSDSRTRARRAAAAALAGEEGPEGALAPLGSYNTYAAARPISSRPPIPGMVSYDSPQTLIGKRDTLMRAKNAALRPQSVQVGMMGSTSPNTSAAASDSGSLRSVSHGTGGAPAPASMSNPNATGSGSNSRRSSMGAIIPSPLPADLDDLPLSQRKAVMRQSSMASVASGNSAGGAPRRSSLGYTPLDGSSGSLVTSGTLNTTKQPQRGSKVPSQAVRESKLARFRQSVQQDQRATPSGKPAVKTNVQPGYSGGYQPQPAPQQPLINSVYGIPGTSSTNSLPPHLALQSYDSEVQRDIDMQRHFLMGQKQAEAQKRQTLKNERELAGRRLEERIRTDGDMIEMHRQAMRRIQRTASQADQLQR